MAKRRYKTTTHTSTVRSAVEDGIMELQSLQEEMEFWKDGLEEKLSHTEKYSQVEEASDLLSNAQEVDVPDSVADLEVSYSMMSKRREPRWMRCANAIAGLQAALDSMSARRDELNELINDDATSEDDADTHQETVDEIESALDELQSIVDECEGVEFPGMYG